MAILKQGCKGKPVEKLQGDLNRLGAKPKLKIDGIFGPLTKAAVQAFQKKAKMKADGAVGGLTEAAILMGGTAPGNDSHRWPHPAKGRQGRAKE